MIVVNKISRGAIFFAKFAAGSLIILLAMMISYIAVLLVISFGFNISFSATEYAAILLLFFCGLVFGSLFVALGLVSSTIARRSSTSLLISLVIWTAFTLLIPTFALDISQAAVELHSPTEISLFSEQTEQDVRTKMWRRRIDETPRALEFFGDGQNSQRPYIYHAPPEVFEDTRDHFLFYERLFQQRADQVHQLERKHDSRRAEQTRTAAILSLVSPYHHLRVAMTNLTGTDYRSHEQHLEVARRYRSEMLASFRRRGYFGDNAIDFISRRPESERTQENYDKTRANLIQRLEEGESIRDILFPKEPLPADIFPSLPDIRPAPGFVSSLPSIAILIILNIVIFTLGFILFLRYDVR
jgi:ABC-type transport system involved in multi-copper enzyme maturation permease subunit